MAYRVSIAAEAMREYEQIVSYLSNALKSPKATQGFADEFIRQVDSIRDNPKPHALSRMPELAAKGYRPLFVNNYVALYKIDSAPSSSPASSTNPRITQNWFRQRRC